MRTLGHVVLMGAMLVMGAAQAQQAPQGVTTDTPAPLASLSKLPPKIATATVRDSSGAIVGAVQRVELSDAGMPTRVDVALIGRTDHVVSLDPAGLTYDAVNNEIRAQSSVAQMRALPHRG